MAFGCSQPNRSVRCLREVYIDDHGCLDASGFAGAVALNADMFQVPTPHSGYGSCGST